MLLAVRAWEVAADPASVTTREETLPLGSPPQTRSFLTSLRALTARFPLVVVDYNTEAESLSLELDTAQRI